jgi:hypothetical protein
LHEELAQMIRMNHKIHTLNLNRCQLKNQEIIESFYVNTKIKSLSLEGKIRLKSPKENEIDYKVISSLSEMLQSNESLEHLNISSKFNNFFLKYK